MRRYLVLLFMLIGSAAQAQYNVQTLNSSAFMSLQTKNNYQTYFNITLIGNVSSVNIDTAPKGAKIDFNICQDATGGRTWVWPSTFQNTSSITISTTASACTQASFITPDGTNWNNAGAGGSSSASSPGWSIQTTSCGSNTQCTQIKGDGKYVIDATSNSTTTVTFPNNDGPVAADQGKTFWATTQGTGIGVGYLLATTYVCPITTIASVPVPGSTITLNVACTASGTANVVAVWGTKDGAALAGLDATVGCNVVHAPANVFILDDQPFFVNPPASGVCGGGVALTSGLTSTVGTPSPALVFDGGGSASQGVLILTPDFNWAGCKAITGASLNVCIGGTLRTATNVQIWGTGLTAASNANCANGNSKIVFSTAPASSTMNGVDVAGVCVGATGMIGIELNSIDEWLTEGGAQSVGSIACQATVKPINSFANDCHNFAISSAGPGGTGPGAGMNVTSTGQVEDRGSFHMDRVNVAGIWSSHGSHIDSSQTAASMTVTATGRSVHDSDFIGVDNSGGGNGQITVASGGTVILRNTQINTNAAAFSLSGALIDEGGNTITGGGRVFTGATATMRGTQVVQGSCTGTVTSAATVGLYGAGQFSATTCTSTTVNLGQVMSASGTILGLSCFAGTAGNQAADACKVVKNGVAQAQTCSLNGVTFCNDNAFADNVSYVQGDVIGIEVIAGTGTTLANVKAAVLAW